MFHQDWSPLLVGIDFTVPIQQKIDPEHSGFGIMKVNGVHHVSEEVHVHFIKRM